jgi:hypothetical protein
MTADLFPISCDNITFWAIRPLFQKIPGVFVLQEADILTFPASAEVETGNSGQTINLLFSQFSQGEKKMLQLRLVQAAQKIGLIFRGIRALQQMPAVGRQAGIMAGGHLFYSVPADGFQQFAEFDTGITDDTGVRSYAFGITTAEILDNLFYENSGQIDNRKRDAKQPGNMGYPANLLQLVGQTQIHVITMHLIFFLEQYRTYRTVDTATHGDGYFFSH